MATPGTIHYIIRGRRCRLFHLVDLLERNLCQPFRCRSDEKSKQKKSKIELLPLLSVVQVSLKSQYFCELSKNGTCLVPSAPHLPLHALTCLFLRARHISSACTNPGRVDCFSNVSGQNSLTSGFSGALESSNTGKLREVQCCGSGDQCSFL